MLTELANGANATAVDQPGLPGESLHLKTGNGGDYHSGEGVGGNGGIVRITLGRGGNGWEESAPAGQFLIEDADGNPLLWIKNGEITLAGTAVLGNVIATGMQCGFGGFLPGGRLFMPKGNVAGNCVSGGKSLIMCNTAGGPCNLVIETNDIAHTAPIYVVDATSNAATNPITVTREGGSLVGVITDDGGSLSLVSDGSNLFKV